MEKHYPIHIGSPTPLGAVHLGKTVNFAIFSQHASSVRLLLFSNYANTPFFEIELHPQKNKTNDIWHVAVEGIPETVAYAYRIDGENNPEKGQIFNPNNLLSDPYAHGLTSTHIWNDGFAHDYEYLPKGKIIKTKPFDWQNTIHPRIPQQDLIIYEAHVRGFTQHKSSGVKHPGTFLGLIEKIPYLKKLGINAIELLPIFEFNECENRLTNPSNGKRLHNFWGYSTVNFFTPMNRFASNNGWDSSIEDCKTLVREMHKNGIEVILDVVYNHTAECGKEGPTLSFKGIDNSVYYLLDEKGEYLNYSGTGNTLNCNHPAVRAFVIDSLKYWVQEFHIDGFRFDLASILTRGTDGMPMESPPLIDEIIQDPVLSQTKLIAEAWDAAGLYQVGSFPGNGIWSEWNGKYRDITRKFIKGTDQQAGVFASALCGSQDLYGSDRAPYHSINFVTAHDGYSLKDLVSYQQKHNEANAENNKDGANDNESWNCGHEGPTKDSKINHLRTRQMKNFLLALLVSAGTPMILMGDEYGHTRDGNNNPYCQDNVLNWFLWEEVEKNHPIFEFCQKLIHFRKKHSHLFCRKEFLTTDDISWHGHQANSPNWDSTSRFVSFTLHDEKGNDIYIAFNAHFEPAMIQLPKTKDKKSWFKVIDTKENEPNDFTENPKNGHPIKEHIKIGAYSAILLQAIE
jgi:isoamylase/glycogen operon protein